MALMLFVWLIVGGGAINVAIHSLMAKHYIFLQLSRYHYPPPSGFNWSFFMKYGATERLRWTAQCRHSRR